jgi:hypothetical protein|tara:strand:+ start:1061 stop:1453 length:393 start_codon:yes stop_codon:yes gene_type:complete
MDLDKRVKMLRDLAVKVALKSPIIKMDKSLIKGLSEKKSIALECQIMGINKVDSFSPQLKENWINHCQLALKMMYDNEVDELAKVARFFGETYEMKFFAQDVKNGNWKNKDALELIAKNMTGNMGDLIIK